MNFINLGMSNADDPLKSPDCGMMNPGMMMCMNGGGCVAMMDCESMYCDPMHGRCKNDPMDMGMDDGMGMGSMDDGMGSGTAGGGMMTTGGKNNKGTAAGGKNNNNMYKGKDIKELSSTRW